MFYSYSVAVVWFIFHVSVDVVAMHAVIVIIIFVAAAVVIKLTCHMAVMYGSHVCITTPKLIIHRCSTPVL